MANIQDYRERFTVMTDEGRNNCVQTDAEPVHSGGIIEIVAGVVYIDAAVWQNYEPTDVVTLSPSQMYALLNSPHVTIVDPGMRTTYDSFQLNKGASYHLTAVRRMQGRHFAIYFADDRSVPSNLRGEMLDVRQVPMYTIWNFGGGSDYVATTRRDGSPIQQSTPVSPMFRSA
jgi:hypothetical protein